MKPGSAGNMIAAIASFFIPGLGQLAQGRLIGVLHFFLAMLFHAVGWVIVVGGLVMHVYSAYEAGSYRPGRYDKLQGKVKDRFRKEKPVDAEVIPIERRA
jgi:hypothetical protein